MAGTELFEFDCTFFGYLEQHCFNITEMHSKLIGNQKKMKKNLKSGGKSSKIHFKAFSSFASRKKSF
jgi:hypothetical protein